MQNPHISINFLCVLHKKNGIVHDTVFSHTLRRNFVNYQNKTLIYSANFKYSVFA